MKRNKPDFDTKTSLADTVIWLLHGLTVILVPIDFKLIISMCVPHNKGSRKKQ